MSDPTKPNDIISAGVSLAKDREQSLTVEVVPRHLKMHNISEYELDALASSGSTLNLTFFGITFGAFISFAIVLYGGGVTDLGKHAMFVMLTWAAGIMATFFGIRGATDYSQWNKKLKNIKQDISNTDK